MSLKDIFQRNRAKQLDTEPEEGGDSELMAGNDAVRKKQLLYLGCGGAVALVLVVAAGFALYARMLKGRWRGVYAVTAMLSFYLLLFVLVAQLFQKVPALHALAPTGSEPPFAIAEGLLLAAFLGLTWLAARRFTTYRPVA